MTGYIRGDYSISQYTASNFFLIKFTCKYIYITDCDSESLLK